MDFQGVVCLVCETPWDEKSLLVVPIRFLGYKDDPWCSNT